MLAALLTTFLWSCSAICAARSARMVGGAAANFTRIVVAAVLLGICAHTAGRHLLGGEALPWFLASGFIGFGLGDVALFCAIGRIGPRLTMLLTHCISAVIAAVTEWLWLGTTLGWQQIACACVILGGIALALAPDRGLNISRRTFWIGVVWGLGSAAGQGLGTVLSRKASMFIPHPHGIADGMVGGAVAAYERILPGMLVALVFFLIARRSPEEKEPGAWPRAWPWIIGNALAGPCIGVAVYQWGVATTPTGILMPVVATSPIITQFLAWKTEGHRPTRRTLLGGIIAVAGVIALAAASGKLTF